MDIANTFQVDQLVLLNQYICKQEQSVLVCINPEHF